MTQHSNAENRPATIRLTNALGYDVTITLDQLSDVHNVLRGLAQHGWRSGNIPVGGILLPLRMFPVFDFRLIGCDTPFVFGSGSDAKLAVRHNGQIYKHRWAGASNGPKRKMPSRLWFSRGATASDEEFNGTDKNAVTYVPLISFSGRSAVTPQFAVPGSMSHNGTIDRVVNVLPGPDAASFGAELEALEQERQDLLRSRSSSHLYAH